MKNGGFSFVLCFFVAANATNFAQFQKHRFGRRPLALSFHLFIRCPFDEFWVPSVRRWVAEKQKFRRRRLRFGVCFQK